MNYKKILSLILFIILSFCLVSCEQKDVENLWKTYVNGVNKQNLQTVASTFYQVDSDDYNNFINNNQTYFDNISSIKSKEFIITLNCDFSSSASKQAYYQANVTADINGSEQKFDLYIYLGDSGMFFTTPITYENGQISNEPNSSWLSQVYYTNDDYNYVYTDDGVKILRQISNSKNVVIPETIDGKTVTEIGSYAFYQYNKILSFTTRKSKMETLKLPETLKTINSYAFFQCDELEELIIPKSVEEIKEMAFTGCRGLKTIKILRETVQDIDTTEKESTHKGNDDKPLVIKGARNMLQGEIINLSILKYEGDNSLVTWSSKSTSVSVNADTGEVYAAAQGTDIEITVSLKSNPQVSATVKIDVLPVENYIKINGDALNRCSSLESLYIYAYNPNTINLSSGTKYNLNSTVKIYVPKGTKSMYLKSAVWSNYADQIYEME